MHLDKEDSLVLLTNYHVVIKGLDRGFIEKTKGSLTLPEVLQITENIMECEVFIQDYDMKEVTIPLSDIALPGTTRVSTRDEVQAIVDSYINKRSITLFSYYTMLYLSKI